MGHSRCSNRPRKSDALANMSGTGTSRADALRNTFSKIVDLPVSDVEAILEGRLSIETPYGDKKENPDFITEAKHNKIVELHGIIEGQYGGMDSFRTTLETLER